MDLGERVDTVIKAMPDIAKAVENSALQGKTRAARLSAGKLVGLVLGCVVVGIMLFMMFAVLGGLLSGEQ